MIENISAISSKAETAVERRASRGEGQIGFTIISLTVSLIAALLIRAFPGRHCRTSVSRSCVTNQRDNLLSASSRSPSRHDVPRVAQGKNPSRKGADSTGIGKRFQ